MDIPAIKAHLPLTQVLAHYGLRPDKNHRLKCPFHDDSTPSLQVYPQTHTCYCFSTSCKTHGKAIDQIDFIMYMDGCTKHEAIVKAQSLLAAPPAAVDVPAVPAAAPPDYESLLRTFQANFKRSPAAQAYAQKRLLHPASGIGYNAAGWPHLKHCLVFPLLDDRGKTVSFYGRSVYDRVEARHFYLKDRRGLYPSYPASYKTRLILTESVIDCATLLPIEGIAKHYALLALYGTNGLTEEHLAAIAAMKGLEEVIFWLDGDEAGAKATAKHAHTLRALYPALRITHVATPAGEDINSLAQGHNDPALFTTLLDERTDFLFSSEAPSSDTAAATATEAAEPVPQPAPETSAGRQAVGILDWTNPEQPHYRTDHLQVTLLGGVSLQYLDRMRVTVYVRRSPHLNPGYSIRQSIDLYQDDVLDKFTRKAAERLDVPTALIAAALNDLTEQLDAWRTTQLAAQKQGPPAARALAPQEKNDALTRLRNPDLMRWTMASYQDTGIAGEPHNAMILHQAMVSRLQDDPVSVICLSASGSGKSYLLEKVAQCFPPELLIENTQMSSNSFYYFQRQEIKGKILLIEDMDGAKDVEYPIRELISKKRISKTVTLKDSRGRLKTVTLTVEGPVTFCGCTTREKLYEDNANRCLLIYLDQGTEQDERIMTYHRRLRAGLIDKQAERRTQELLQHMQQLLRPQRVVNPYAPLIDLPASVFKPRRTLGLLLSFIDSITLYHQYQCPRDPSGALLTQPEHIAWGLTLLKDVLFRKSDELSAPLRTFLERLQALLKGHQGGFYGQDVRRSLRLAPRTLGRYLYELHQYGYVKITGGSPYRKGYEYQLTPPSEGLRQGIDQHIERVMQRVHAARDPQHPDSRPVGQQSANMPVADLTKTRSTH